MRKIVALAAAAVAASLMILGCRSAAPAGGQAGALSAQAAVQEFLAAAHGGDVRTMASLFGTTNGSITQRDAPNDVEKRMRTLQCFLTHDSARIVDDLPGTGAKTRQLTVELRKGTLARQTSFTAVPGPHDRWFVENFDINAVRDLCRP